MFDDGKQEALPNPLMLVMPSVTQENQMSCRPRRSDFYATNNYPFPRAPGEPATLTITTLKGVPVPVLYDTEYVEL